jgi:hypothetical protein
MLRFGLGSVAVIGTLALASLALSHELIYIVAHGVGDEYAAAMRAGGHDRYWTSFLLIVALVSTALAVVTFTQLRRLRRLAASVRARSVRIEDVGYGRFFRLLAPLWLRLAVVVVAAYFVQENIETVTTGVPLPGLAVLTGAYWLALPLLLFVSLLVASVGALFGWRREVILARLRAARRRLRAPALVQGLAHSARLARSIFAARQNGLRAPPLLIAGPA